ncbi:glycoside hydrolase family 47 protein [Amanita muscaria Koide BX008]|uniref:alpha-1,2-Mannosidase n=1 Tax=Amanita muscaria (strain Koide BX008) TaxID=946122 RepID=A0A0C2WZG1_AMAMK|nr:glycoside hydrolase family 47 protein [Amanita muscaria Koide BX008]
MADKAKMRAVVDAFKHAWAAYERNAMGYDEYHPLTKRGTNFSLKGGIGYMIIDALDTIQIMGLEDEYKRARQWIADSLSFDRDENFNLFETTIRVLGGLLSAYHLSHNDTLYLEKAIDLADRLLPAFDTASGVPQAMSNLGQRVGIYDRGNGGMVSTAEATTLQLEFRYLSHISGNNTYWDKAEKVLRIVKDQTLPLGGLAPIFMQPEKGEFALTDIRLGSRGDSFYEYLLKQYIQTNQTEPVYRKMYDKTMRAVQDRLVKKSMKKGLSYTVELQANYRINEEPWKESPKQDHLVCFLGGSLMLGTRFGGSDLANARDWKTGEALVEGCMATHETETGLSPEIVYWRVQGDNLGDTYPNDWYIKGSYGVARGGSWTKMTSYDARYILRPETVESLFLAYRLSGDNKYREWGWGIFQSIEKYCRLESGGYASIVDVDDANSRKDDKMETFFLAETLKYLYLLFSDDTVIPLNEYVFNTEAHPLPIFTPSLDRRWLEG